MSRARSGEELRRAARAAPLTLALEVQELTRRHPRTALLLGFVAGVAVATSPRVRGAVLRGVARLGSRRRRR